MSARRPIRAAALLLALAAPAHAQPGGHDHAGHDHAGHDHAQSAGQAAIDALRAPLVGNWMVDYPATIDVMAKTAPAIVRGGRDAAVRELEKVLGDVRMSFTPDGGVLMGQVDGLKRGLYVVEAGPGAGMTIYIYDTADNALATSEYAAERKGDRLHLTHAGDTMVLRHPTAAEVAGGSDPAAPALDPRLVGRWTVDAERTLSADPRVRAMTAEQRKLTLDSLSAFFGRVAFTFEADGGASTAMGGDPKPARWRVTERRGDHLEVELIGPEGNETLSLDLDGRYLRMLITSQKNAVPLVLRKQ